MSSEKRDGMHELTEMIKRLQVENAGSVKIDVVIEEMEKLGYDKDKINRWIETGKLEAIFSYPRYGLIRVL
jgi:DNA replicative helicase MCM subunit Mcm2 (Cdc46/Mcm family)